MSPTPICLFVNCLDVTVSSSEVNARAHPLTLLKDIPDLTETPDTAPRWDNSVTRQWAIKNKYYTLNTFTYTIHRMKVNVEI